MPIAWYAVPYKRRDLNSGPGRYCAMDDFTVQILADGGDWTESEGLGDNAIVKVRASNATLTLIDAAPGFVASPKRWSSLQNFLTDMTAGERNTFQNKFLSLGYTQAEINAAMGSTLALWQSHTLKHLLSLFVSRRNKPRYDAGTDTIILDGPNQPTRSIENVDATVK